MNYKQIIFVNLIGAVLLTGSVTRAAEVTVSEAEKPSGLTDLLKKAEERDHYASMCLELQQRLDKLEAGNSKPAGPGGLLTGKTQGGRLYDLELRAEKAATLVHDLAAAEKSLVALQKECDETKTELARVSKERDTAQARSETLQDVVDSLNKQAKGLRQTVRRLLLGEFEYYEVKEGDSLASIAANPMIYNDPSRANWLRQANDGRVKDLSNLRTGEMLVIPRFPQNGSYEF